MLSIVATVMGVGHRGGVSALFLSFLPSAVCIVLWCGVERGGGGRSEACRVVGCCGV